MRQYVDSFDSLVSLWWRPGSTTVGRGFIVTNPSPEAKVHHSSQCVDVWEFDIRTETVFNHPEEGDYVLSADGVRRGFRGWCSRCDPNKPVKIKVKNNHKRDEARAAKRAAVEEYRRVRDGAL